MSAISVVIEEAQPSCPNGTPSLGSLVPLLSITAEEETTPPPATAKESLPDSKANSATSSVVSKTLASQEVVSDAMTSAEKTKTEEETKIPVDGRSAPTEEPLSVDKASEEKNNSSEEPPEKEAPKGASAPETQAATTDKRRKRSSSKTKSLDSTRNSLGASVNSTSPLEAVFQAFATFGDRSSKKVDNDGVPSVNKNSNHNKKGETAVLLDGAKFVKMMKDSKLAAKNFTTTDMDIIFNKALKKGERKISFQQFSEEILPAIAQRKSLTEDAVSDILTAVGGPQLHSSVNISSTTPAAAAKKDKSSPAPRSHSSSEPVSPAPNATNNTAGSVAATTLEPELEASLKKTFIAFASFGASGSTSVDGSKFAKLCKDSGLVDLAKFFSMIDVDISFNKTVKKGERRINFDQFRDGALPLISQRRKETTEETAKIIAACSGPVIHKASPTPNRSGSTKKRKNEEGAMLAKLAAAANETGENEGSSMLAMLSEAGGASKENQDPNNSSTKTLSAPVPEHSSLSPMKRSTANELSPAAVHSSGDHSTAKKQYRSVEDSLQQIQNYRDERNKLRRERKAAEKERKKRELEEAERIIEMKRKEEEQTRAEREQQMHERLLDLKQRREARELEYLVGERRAKEVLTRKTLTDKFEEDYARKLREEENERQALLEERRMRYRQPVLVGVEEAERLLKENEAKKSRRALEVKSQLDHAEATKPVHWHGKSYLRATEEFVRHKSTNEDQKHSALYRHAKMQEFGKLVKHIADEKGQVPLPYSHACLKALTPMPTSKSGGFNPGQLPGQGQGGRSSAPLTSAKDPLSIKDRVKMGNDFLKQAIREKPALPPGLKLNPLETEDSRLKKEHEQFKKRKKQGDQFLRELRDSTGHVQTKPPEDEKDYLADVRKLRSKATSIENKLAVRGVDLKGTRTINSTTMDRSAEELVGEVDDVLECVQTKLKLLERIEKFENPTNADRRAQP